MILKIDGIYFAMMTIEDNDTHDVNQSIFCIHMGENPVSTKVVKLVDSNRKTIYCVEEKNILLNN